MCMVTVTLWTRMRMLTMYTLLCRSFQYLPKRCIKYLSEVIASIVSITSAIKPNNNDHAKRALQNWRPSKPPTNLKNPKYECISAKKNAETPNAFRAFTYICLYGNRGNTAYSGLGNKVKYKSMNDTIPYHCVS